MNIMNRLAWRSLWKNRTRTIVTIVGIILSAAMFTAVTTLGVSLISYLVDITIYNSGNYFIRFDNATPEQVADIQQREEISQLGTAKALGYANVGTAERNQSYILSALDENAFAMRPIHLEEGRLPEKTGEIAVPEHCLWYLNAAGMGGLGDVITIDVVPQFEDPHYYDYMPEFPIENIPYFTASYVIVGILENESSRLSDWHMEPMNFITVDDGTRPYHWARLFAKTANPMDAYPLESEGLAAVCSVNTDLLNYYGASKYTNINELICTICAILMAIILTCSVSLIYNAFSISLSERSKDFGLLSSVGATKKQLRRSVYFEALALSLIGVPLGLVFGYGGIAVTLTLTGDLIAGLMAGSLKSGAVFRAVPSLPAFLCAGAVAVLTVLISAGLPLRKAMKLDPIRSIRQSGDYKIPKKLKSGTLSQKVFGVPGLMSGKYYAVSRRKYRSTVISLSLSVIIFLTSVGFTGIFTELADESANTSNFDFSISATHEQYEQIRELDFVEKSTLVWEEQCHGFVTEGPFMAEYLEHYELVMDTKRQSNSFGVKVFFLEDTDFRAYLTEQGLDPGPYFADGMPQAVCVRSRSTVYNTRSDGTVERRVVSAPVFSELPAFLSLHSQHIPTELAELLFSFGGGFDFSVTDWTDWQGHLVQRFTVTDAQIPDGYPVNADGSLSFIRIPRTTKTGETVFDYHYFSLDTQTPGEYLMTDYDTPAYPAVEVRTQTDELPFGVDQYSGPVTLSLILPESSMFTDASESLQITVKDYNAAISWLQGNLEDYQYQDHLHSQMQYRNLITMIHVFSYGFIVLISLICICNVFNTISTNIALRRRDFGMLRSVGMTGRELNRMMFLECARYGVRSLLMGIPIGTAIGYVIYLLLNMGEAVPYCFPLGPICMAAAAVFLVVFITMRYAVHKLRRDNPITAIRMDAL